MILSQRNQCMKTNQKSRVKTWRKLSWNIKLGTLKVINYTTKSFKALRPVGLTVKNNRKISLQQNSNKIGKWSRKSSNRTKAISNRSLYLEYLRAKMLAVVTVLVVPNPSPLLMMLPRKLGNRRQVRKLRYRKNSSLT